MRKITKARVAGLVCGAATLAGTESAWALDKYIDLEPPKVRSGVGYGYDSIKHEHKQATCVTYGPGTDQDDPLDPVQRFRS